MTKREKIERTERAAERARKIPDRLNWKITAIVYGHGKVLVQAVTPSGKPAQFTEKI